ncbi:uncharacterized protein G2W53_040967 [Senna tora]|uniref:Uncharacterized protein n=1 Tax=Senna tora TaxID=362788 RepID=A0A834SEE4_9FABA|nr:uncharacterized protein G2W53_040967 [Senna tora]
MPCIRTPKLSEEFLNLKSFWREFCWSSIVMFDRGMDVVRDVAEKQYEEKLFNKLRTSMISGIEFGLDLGGTKGRARTPFGACPAPSGASRKMKAGKFVHHLRKEVVEGGASGDDSDHQKGEGRPLTKIPFVSVGPVGIPTGEGGGIFNFNFLMLLQEVIPQLLKKNDDLWGWIKILELELAAKRH